MDKNSEKQIGYMELTIDELRKKCNLKGIKKCESLTMTEILNQLYYLERYHQ
jgi:hypothetical protein